MLVHRCFLSNRIGVARFREAVEDRVGTGAASRAGRVRTSAVDRRRAAGLCHRVGGSGSSAIQVPVVRTAKSGRLPQFAVGRGSAATLILIKTAEPGNWPSFFLRLFDRGARPAPAGPSGRGRPRAVRAAVSRGPAGTGRRRPIGPAGRRLSRGEMAVDVLIHPYVARAEKSGQLFRYGPTLLLALNPVSNVKRACQHEGRVRDLRRGGRPTASRSRSLLGCEISFGPTSTGPALAGWGCG